MKRRSLAFVAAVLAIGVAAAADAQEPAFDEFVGPFPSWADVKADYGAIGDGKADDTAPLQKALDDLRKENAAKKVLYLPAGTYRLTGTLELLRATHNEATGVSIVGEAPDSTILRWDGPAGGVMMLYNPWYARMGRLTFDGAGRALTAVRHGEKFTTFNEYADAVFKDCGFGIEAGMKDGIAETAVLRCRFVRCSQAGISIQNWNSLDWWIWHSLFEGCRTGLTNLRGAGHFHVYESVFRGSTEADMTIGNTMYFGIRNNTSIGSKAFFAAGGIGAGCPTMIQGNLVLDPHDAAPIRIGNLGPVFLFDNVVRGREGAAGPAVTFGKETAKVLAGNTFTVQGAADYGGRCVSLGDLTVPRGQIKVVEPVMPGPPPNQKRRIIEVAAGGDAAAVQKAIDEAAGLAGRRPVIHLAAGKYRIARTLTVPGGCDLQLVGDGALNATVLEWAGEGDGPLLVLDSPCRAVLREMHVGAGKKADAVVLPQADQVGGRVFGEQVSVSGGDAGLLVEGLARTAVLLHDFGHSDCRIGVKVVGPGEAQTKRQTGRVIIFSGASSNNALSYDVSGGGWLLARDIWYESGQQPLFMRCTDSGTFTLDGANVAYPRSETPGINVSDFRGRITFLGCIFTDVSKTPGTFPAVVVCGEGKDTRVLLLGCHGNGEYFTNQSPKARAARLAGVTYTGGGGAKPIADAGGMDDAQLREMLDQTRGARPQALAPVPAGATDARFFRVTISGKSGLVVRAGK
jgi:hypothetical protein